MALNEFLDQFHIDIDALNRIKKRVFIVGRFNQRFGGAEPDIFLFTNRPGSSLSERYARNFSSQGNASSVFGMDYGFFVQALQPAIAEKVEEKNNWYRFQTVEQVVPTGKDDLREGASVIDVFNYFFQRAVANSEQQAYRETQPGLPKELLKADLDRGKAILKQIRGNLNTFCTFQPQTHRVVDNLAVLLSQCSREHGLPAFAHGWALPGGLAERLLDFVYAEDARAPFDASGLDFSGPWEKLKNDRKSREMFANVVSAFRDSLLGIQLQQYTHIRFKGTQPLSRLAQEAISDELKSDFQQARVAFNGLRQILRSKVLLSMILEWLLSTYYEIDDLADLGNANQAKRDGAVEKAIMERWRQNGLAKPVRRPTREERARFSALLTAGFSDVLKAIIAPDAELGSVTERLAEPLRELVESVRSDTRKRDLLTKVAGSDLDPDLQKAFLGASRTVLLDVLCPALYRNPIITTQMLKSFFRQEVTETYLTAIFLADSTQEDVRAIAEKHLEFFESKIDKATQEIRDENEILSRLLGDFLNVFTQPEIQRRLTEGIRVLQEVHSLYENTELEKERQGAGSISASRPFDELEGTLKETPIDREIIKVAAKQRVEAKLEQTINRITDAVPDSESGATENGMTANDESPDEKRTGIGPTRLDRKIDEIMDKVLSDHPISPDEGVTKTQRRALAEEISGSVLGDEEVVGNLAEDLAAFERTLNLIYRRYIDNPDKRNFRNKVERMTLINMMLLFQKELGLGRVSSNLYHLLLDLVLYLDPDNPDPRDFQRERSLTQYFDDADLEKGGITMLRDALEVQASRSLAAIQDFVSELQGIKYLMDRVQHDPDAEVIVVNASADEFMNWLRDDHLSDEESRRALLRGGKLVDIQSASDTTIPPGLVYMTNTAFGGNDPQPWIEALEQWELNQEGFSYLIPPLCLGTGPQGDIWAEQGRAWAKAAARVPAPIVVLGPSPRLNPQSDGFKTYLPAGYLLAAHFLSAPDQRLKIKNVRTESNGRFRVIGSGAAEMRESLNRVLWGEGAGDSYAFAVDFFLYIVLLLLATARGYKGTESPNVEKLLSCFCDPGESLNKTPFRSTDVLSQCLLGNNALAFAFDQNPTRGALESVTFSPDRLSLLQEGIGKRQVTNLAWFNLARVRAALG